MPVTIRRNNVHNAPVESFRTHSNYLRAIHYLILGPNSFGTTNLYGNIAQLIASSGLIQENLRDNFDMDQVKTCLQSAWGTEALLLMTGEVFQEEEAIRLSNNWLAIQTYYVMYHCAQALQVAQGHPRPESHPRTQNAFHNQWVNRRGLLHPWTVGYGPLGAINLPNDVNVDLNVHSWSSCEGDNIWSLFTKALMTTRRDEVLEKNRIKRETKKKALRRCWELEEAGRIVQGKPRKQPVFPLPLLTADDKGIDASTRAFTLIDYIYRLRIRRTTKIRICSLTGQRWLPIRPSSFSILQYCLRDIVPVRERNKGNYWERITQAMDQFVGGKESAKRFYSWHCGAMRSSLTKSREKECTHSEEDRGKNGQMLVR